MKAGDLLLWLRMLFWNLMAVGSHFPHVVEKINAV